MSKLDLEARRERHRKLFEGQYHTFIGKFWFHFKRVLQAIWFFLLPAGKRISNFMHPLDSLPAPKRLYTQLALWSLALLMVTSINVRTGAYEGGQGVELSYLALDEAIPLVSDEEGYIVKSMPIEGTTVYDQNRTEMATHEVQAGDTLSVLAYRYGIKVDSIRYANPDLRGDNLKTGQELKIPPKDGLYVEVKDGDSLAKLIEKYKGNADATKLFNEMDDDTALLAGDQIFIIDGKPIKVTPTTPSYTNVATTGGGSSAAPEVSYYDLPVSEEGWVRPTTGQITQGYHAGHYAYDVADRSKPAIVAAASGTVIKASSGTLGGGYGNHIIIDHGNGYTTLYAHCETLYVNVGDYVTQGQVIAKMGNTGRVYGATGIHLHFEVTYNGVKQSPSIIGVW